MQERLDLAVRAARAGGDVLRQFRLQALELDVREKPDRTLVTRADLAASAAVHEVLSADPRRTFILDEEVTRLHDRERPQKMWIVDPLDGTRWFAEGLDDFCVLIAYVVGNNPVIGVIYFPMNNTLYYGGHRSGVWRQVGNDEPVQLHARRVMRLDQARLTGPNKPSLAALYQKITRALGTKPFVSSEPSGQMYASLLTDQADLIITRPGKPSVWDVAAGHALLRELGGELVDLDGEPINYRKHTSLKNGTIAAIDRGLLLPILGLMPPRHELIDTP